MTVRRTSTTLTACARRSKASSRSSNESRPGSAGRAAAHAKVPTAKLHFGGNADGPCVAWQNETLCKLLYVNLRLIVQYEIATGYRMNFQTDTFFPSLPEDDKLIA